MILAKALTGGYLPLAITLLTEQIFAEFSVGPGEENTPYYGHSYTGNALACAAANASLDVFAAIASAIVEVCEGREPTWNGKA